MSHPYVNHVLVWLTACLLALILGAAHHLERTPVERIEPVAANLGDAIKLACVPPHSSGGYINRYGDIQCVKDGKPSFYVHVVRSQP